MSKNPSKPNQESSSESTEATKDTTSNGSAEDTTAGEQGNNEGNQDDVVVKDLAAAVSTATGAPAVTPSVDPAVLAAAVAAGTPTPETVKEPTFNVTPDVVKGDKQVNQKGSAATALIVERVQRHMAFLKSEIRIASEKDRNIEQASFMETVGEALKQDYDRFEIVADLLMDAVRENAKLFNSGLAFRFIAPLEKQGYAPEALQGYKAFFQFLINVAKNWKRRHQLQQFVDLTYVIEGFPSKARENITHFYNKLASA